ITCEDRCICPQIPIPKTCITQAGAERIYRRCTHVYITSCVSPAAFDPVRLRQRITIVNGQLADAARNGDRQTSAWVVVAKEDISNRFCSALAGLPRLNDRRDMF